MTKKKPLTLGIFLFVVLTDFLETAAQFCFKKAALAQQAFSVTDINSALQFIFSIAMNPLLWGALFFVFVLFCIWITILSNVDLSVAVPVASFSYILIPLVSVLFLGEKISFLRGLGIGFILIGVILVSISSQTQQSEAR